MTTTTNSKLHILTNLRATLQLDAVVTGANGIAYLAAGSVLDDLLGIPSGWLRAVGAFLVVYALIVAAIGSPATISRRLAYGVAGANAVWVLTSIGVVVTGWHSPTLSGTIWIIAQACVVAVFAELQVTALRRARSRN